MLAHWKISQDGPHLSKTWGAPQTVEKKAANQGEIACRGRLFLDRLDELFICAQVVEIHVQHLREAVSPGESLPEMLEGLVTVTLKGEHFRCAVHDIHI
jgi:hypothetical protein